MSQKVEKFVITPVIQSEINLPKKNFEPFFLKVLNDFIHHHNLPKDIPVPNGCALPHKIFSYIVDILAHSMGEEKRNQLIKELEDYKLGLPFDLR